MAFLSASGTKAVYVQVRLLKKTALMVSLHMELIYGTKSIHLREYIAHL